MLPPPPPKNYKISSAFSYNFKSALTILPGRFRGRGGGKLAGGKLRRRYHQDVFYCLLHVFSRYIVPILLGRAEIKLVVTRFVQLDCIRGHCAEIQRQRHGFNLTCERAVECAGNARALDLFRNLRNLGKRHFRHAVKFGCVLIYGKTVNAYICSHCCFLLTPSTPRKHSPRRIQAQIRILS